MKELPYAQPDRHARRGAHPGVELLHHRIRRAALRLGQVVDERADLADEDARFRRSYYSETTPTTVPLLPAPMTRLDSERSSMMGQAMPTLEICPICGWWVVTDRAGYSYGYEGFTQIGRAAGILRELHQTTFRSRSKSSPST